MTTSSQPVPQKAFRRTGAKKEVLAYLAEYFCLRTNDLVQLHYGDQKESHQRAMRRRIELLEKQSLVRRLPYLELDLDRGGRTFACGLTDRGVKLARELHYYPHAKTIDEHSQRTLDHELEISFFHVALNVFCEQNNLTLYWQQRDLKCTVNPDVYFAITDHNKPEGKNTFNYFLEIERAKLGSWKNGEPQIIRKLGKYYDYYNTTGCEKEWGHFRQFRVIVVQRTEQKREFLVSKLAEKYSHRMFWLTTENLYKNGIGAPIFRTPKDYASKSYGFLDV